MGKSRRLELNEAIKKSQDKFGQSSEVVPLRPNDTEKPPPIIEPEVEIIPDTGEMQLEKDKPLLPKGLPRIYPIMVLLIMGVILAFLVINILTGIYDKVSPQSEEFTFVQDEAFQEDFARPSQPQNNCRWWVSANSRANGKCP